MKTNMTRKEIICLIIAAISNIGLIAAIVLNRNSLPDMLLWMAPFGAILFGCRVVFMWDRNRRLALMGIAAGILMCAALVGLGLSM